MTSALIVALILGLRHATDPDHLAAVSVLAVSDEGLGGRSGGLLGLSWGFGHALTLIAFGLPIIMLDARLPEAVQRGVEFAVGAMIVLLAAGLLFQWRDGRFLLGEGGVSIGDDDSIRATSGRGDQVLVSPPVRSPPAAFGIGLVHGIGGSAAAGILLVTAMASRSEATLALLVFALGTAISMALASSLLGVALTRAARGFKSFLVPLLGAASLLFGFWYVVDALIGP